jgi:cell division inhibitor SepF
MQIGNRIRQMFKMTKMWMGPDDKVFNQGFDHLFKVNEEYKIPEPSRDVKDRLKIMQDQDDSRVLVDNEGFDLAMDNVFGSRKESVNPRSVETPRDMSYRSPSPLQVVQNGSSALNIVVVEPRSFEDSLEIVNYLKERKSVIVNLQYLDRDVSQRVIDFVSGATLALDGSQERVGHGVFIFASMNCQVETESEGIKAYKDLFAKTFG